jgi:hypothetical protein
MILFAQLSKTLFVTLQISKDRRNSVLSIATIQQIQSNTHVLRVVVDFLNVVAGDRAIN